MLSLTVCRELFQTEDSVTDLPSDSSSTEKEELWVFFSPFFKINCRFSEKKKMPTRRTQLYHVAPRMAYLAKLAVFCYLFCIVGIYYFISYLWLGYTTKGFSSSVPFFFFFLLTSFTFFKKESFIQCSFQLLYFFLVTHTLWLHILTREKFQKIG